MNFTKMKKCKNLRNKRKLQDDSTGRSPDDSCVPVTEKNQLR